MPLAMKPAPTIPTLIGSPARSSRSSSRSTMNMRRLLLIRDGDETHAVASEVGPAAVLVGNDRRLGWPADTEGGIVPAHAALGGRRVELGDEIGHLGLVLEGQKGIGAALRDEQHPIVRRAELDRQVTHEGRRLRTQVEQHVMHGATNATQELVFLIRGDLVVKAAQRVLVAVEGDVHLHDPVGQAAVPELASTPTAGKEAAIVSAPLKL